MGTTRADHLMPPETDDRVRLPYFTEGPRLNVACGVDGTEGFVRLDRSLVAEPDILADARKLPFRDESFGEIRSWHILEHFERSELVPTMNEWWRILVNGGVIDLEFPIFPSREALDDPTHLSLLSQGMFEYFLKGGLHEDHRQLYGIRPWYCKDRKILGMNSIMWLLLEKVPECGS